MNWHELVLAAIAMTAGFARGIHEGMAMISMWDEMCSDMSVYPGVRSHRWFRWYHAVSAVRSAGMIGLGAALMAGWWDWMTLAGSVFLLWEATETGMALARQGRLWYKFRGAYYEALNFFDIFSMRLTAGDVTTLRVARLSIGISLVLMGGRV